MKQVQDKLHSYHFDIFLKTIFAKTFLCHGLIVEATLTACSYANVSAEFHVDLTNVKHKMVLIIFHIKTKENNRVFLEIQSEETSEFSNIPFFLTL